jgi:hypothetical protein
MAKEGRKGGDGKSAGGDGSRKPTLAQALKVTATLAALGASLGVNVETLFAASAADPKGSAGVESFTIKGEGAATPKLAPGASQDKHLPAAGFLKRSAVPDSDDHKVPASPGALQKKIDFNASQNKAFPGKVVNQKDHAPGANQIKFEGRQHKVDGVQGKVETINQKVREDGSVRFGDGSVRPTAPSPEAWPSKGPSGGALK